MATSSYWSQKFQSNNNDEAEDKDSERDILSNDETSITTQILTLQGPIKTLVLSFVSRNMRRESEDQI